jgi:catechol 2,3-dioxygenase-like lactoylglutathione lyase family enzyme
MNLTTARLFVSNIEDARDFYAHTLGLRLLADGSRFGYCVFAAGPISLVVESVAPDAPADDQILVGRFSGLSFAVDDIAKTHRELADKGVVFTEEPERQAWGGIVATFKDPAGNQLQLAQHPT